MKKVKKEKPNKLKRLAIAYEFSRCHGYGISEDEVDDMWKETSFKKGEVETKGIGEFQGLSTNEISDRIVSEILSS